MKKDTITKIQKCVEIAIPFGAAIAAVWGIDTIDNDLTNGAINIGSKTTTSFIIKKWSSDQTSWQVSGMAA